MDNLDLIVQSAYLATKNRWNDRELHSGEFRVGDSPNNFVFYLLEIFTPYPNPAVAKKILRILESDVAEAGEVLDASGFEKILEDVNFEMGAMAESGDNGWIGNINAVLGLVYIDEISIAQTGNLGGYIFRKGKISTLTEKMPPNYQPHAYKTFTDITSGQVAPDDEIIFGNLELFNYIPLDRIKEVTKVPNPRHQAAEFSRALKRGKAFDANAIFISFSSQTPPKSEDDLPRVIFVDEPDENFKKFYNKNVAPFLAVFGNGIQKVSRQLFDSSAKATKKFSKNWQEKYGPASSMIAQKGINSLSKNIKKAGVKLEPQIAKLTNYHANSKVEIKSAPYNRPAKSDWGKKIGGVILFIFNIFKLLFKPQNRKYLYIGLIIIAILIGYSKVKENNSKKTVVTAAIEASGAYDKAAAQFKQAQDDIALGKTISIDQLNSILTLSDQAQADPANKTKAIALSREIKSVIDDRVKAVRFYDVVGYHLSNNITKVVLAGSEIYGIDSSGKIYLADTRDKSAKLVGALSADQGAALTLTYSAYQKSIIVATDKNKILEVSTDTHAVTELTGGPFEKATALATYSSNIYLLSVENPPAIWKHLLSSDGTYSKGSNYASTKSVSLANSIDMAIDGNIYVLKSDGTAIRYVKGVPDADFSIKAAPAPDTKLTTPARIYTDETTNYVFILDKKTNRIVKYSKSGDFVNQYIFDGLSIDDFVVNAKLQKIWALSGGTIYEGNL